MITKTQIIQWLTIYSVLVTENKDYLTDLDAAIGDADHGINMERGFSEVTARLPALEAQDVGALLKSVGMTLLSKVGGASGPLYGTLFMRLAMVTTGKEALTADELFQGLASGVEGIQQRGSSKPGEKTMVDALVPAIDALGQALGADTTPAKPCARATVAAEEGMKATIPMQATKGRASYLGPRSIGHQDPGATSAYLLIKAAADAICA